MKRETTAKRINKIMEDRRLRQVDILNLAAPYCKQYGVKMNKSDISQYCSGKTEPNQDKLFVLGMALDVNESWLMGLDVPMGRIESRKAIERPNMGTKALKERRIENQIIENMNELNDNGKKNLLNYSKVLIGNPEFAKEDKSYLKVVAAHERTDIEVTDEMRKYDDDIMNDENF